MKHLMVIGYAVLALLLSSCNQDASASEGCEGGACEHHEHHCEVKLSKPEYFSGNGCPVGEYLMQGHQSVKLPNGNVVAGVRCVKIEQKCEE